MEVKAIYRFAKISPFKAREVTREIQGMPALEALERLLLVPKKAAPLIAKTLKSAIANAENNNDMRPEALVIKEAVVGEAATIKRFRPRGKGSADTIRKRNSHLRIILTDEITIERREDRLKKSHKAQKNKIPKKQDQKKDSLTQEPQKGSSPSTAQDLENEASIDQESIQTTLSTPESQEQLS